MKSRLKSALGNGSVLPNVAEIEAVAHGGFRSFTPSQSSARPGGCLDPGTIPEFTDTRLTSALGGGVPLFSPPVAAFLSTVLPAGASPPSPRHTLAGATAPVLLGVV